MASGSPLFPFDNSYARLPERFFGRVEPSAVAEPGLIQVNGALALELGLKHGMRLAAISGVKGVFTDEDIAKVRELALEARAKAARSSPPQASAPSE